jgi:hypothetical protein
MALHAAYCGKLVDFTAQGQLITAPRFELGAIGAGLHERRYHKLLVKKSFQDRGTGALVDGMRSRVRGMRLG